MQSHLKPIRTRGILSTAVVFLSIAACTTRPNRNDHLSEYHTQPFFHHITIRIPGHISDVKLVDANRDSLKDLLVLHNKYEFKQDSISRMISLYLFHEQTYPSSPCTSLFAYPEDILVDWFDTSHSSNQGYLLILRSDGIWGYPVLPSGQFNQAEQLVNESSLFPVADKRRLSFAQLHADVNGDGTNELILPTSQQLNVYQLTKHHSFEFSKSFVFPINLEINDDTDNRLNVPAMSVRYPNFVFKDFNSNGLKDLVCTMDDKVSVFLSNLQDAIIVHEPDTTFNLGVITVEEKQINKDVDLEIIIDDINGDNRVDVFVRKQSVSPLGDTIGQFQFFHNKSDGFASVPDQIISTQYIEGEPILRDFNRDGMLDFCILTVKFDLLSLFRLLLSKGLESEYRIYLMNAHGRYPKKPTQKIRFAHTIDLRNPFQYLPVQSFDGDFDGDGRSDLLVQTGEDEISIYWGQNTKVFGEQPSLKLEGKISHNLIVDDINMDKHSDLIFWYDKGDSEEGVLDIYLFR